MKLCLDFGDKLPVKPKLGENFSAEVDQELFIYLEQVSLQPSIAKVLIVSAYKKLHLHGEIRVVLKV